MLEFGFGHVVDWLSFRMLVDMLCEIGAPTGRLLGVVVLLVDLVCYYMVVNAFLTGVNSLCLMRLVIVIDFVLSFYDYYFELYGCAFMRLFD